MPGSSQTKFVDVVDGRIRIQIKAQTQDNEANQALIKFLSKEFKTPQKEIIITAGQKSRLKSISIKSPKVIPLFIQEATQLGL